VEKLTESGAAARDEESTREVVRTAARVARSLSDNEFDVSFNPDVFQDHIKHAQPEVAFCCTDPTGIMRIRQRVFKCMAMQVLRFCFDILDAFLSKIINSSFMENGIFLTSHLGQDLST